MLAINLIQQSRDTNNTANNNVNNNYKHCSAVFTSSSTLIWIRAFQLEFLTRKNWLSTHLVESIHYSNINM